MTGGDVSSRLGSGVLTPCHDTRYGSPMNPSAIQIARLFAGYHLGDPTWADKIAAILADPTEAEGNLRDEFHLNGYDFDAHLAAADRYAGQR